MVKMSMEEQKQSHGMDEDRQHPNYNMPRKLKKVADAEGNLREMLRRESLNNSQQMQKVPPVLRLENNSNDYDPMVVSLGPYHHGKTKLRPAENFKVKALQHIIVDTGKSVQVFFDKISEQVSDVKGFYIEDPKKKFSDSTFAQMMLLDSCFIISYILAPTNPRFASTILSDLGHLDFAIIYRDLFLLENQIPLKFLKDVIYWGYDSKGHGLVDDFIYKFSNFSRSKRKEISSDELGIHFLDACRRVLLSECEKSVHSCCIFRFGWHEWTFVFRRLMTCVFRPVIYVFRRLMTRWIKEKYDDEYTWEQHVPRFHSALDLKANGIHFRPSRDYSLTGLYFKSGYSYARLQLPILHVSTHTKVFFSNLIAYESCLESPERKVTAYVKFMKSLIVHADDVKELREKGILFTSLGSDEEVVKMFKELSTSTLSTEKAFEDVRVEIQKYFQSKFKPRLGEFLYTYFRSPWTAIGTIAAIILLLLTLTQTYFTIWGTLISSRNGNH